jgi:tetratricopeptide (TPR) repeat protein
MVVMTKGAVTLERGSDKRPLRVMDLLRAGDALETADDEVLIVLLDDGQRERIKPKQRATVAAKGCAPAAAVERQEKDRVPAAQLTGLRDLARNCRAGVSIPRGERPATIQVVTPMYGTTVPGARPTLSWQAVEKAESYQAELWNGNGQRLLWRATTAEPRLAYPDKEAALQPGTKYLWRVYARQGENLGPKRVVDSKFMTLTKAEARELADLPRAAVSADVAEMLLAATTYEALGVYEEALALYEKLAMKLPGGANVQIALAGYYERAGREEQARMAREKARKLWAVLPEH